MGVSYGIAQMNQWLASVVCNMEKLFTNSLAYILHILRILI